MVSFKTVYRWVCIYYRLTCRLTGKKEIFCLKEILQAAKKGDIVHLGGSYSHREGCISLNLDKNNQNLFSSLQAEDLVPAGWATAAAVSISLTTLQILIFNS